MIHFFRKIRFKLMGKRQTGKYLKYALGEIVLVVIGILIALQINNWNNGRLERKEEKKSYANIKRQLLDDKNELAKVKGYNLFYNGAYEYANKLIISKDPAKTDSLALIALILSQYSDFHKSGNIYATLVNSGDLKLLKNAEIPSQLQHLEMTYIFANKLEDMHWEIIINELSKELRGVINYATFKPVKPEKLYAVEMQNIFMESIYMTRAKDSVYSKALREIDSLIVLIDTELKINE